MTASPEWWKEATPRQQAEFFARSEQWLEKKYGKDRVVAAVVHRDEATPHLSAFWVHFRNSVVCGTGGDLGARVLHIKPAHALIAYTRRLH
ncbi:plasmid recombination protein, partial [Salmonella enterica]|uniref:plasmid recombination protein n=1 Tax=Salmonella enterica TaxID=28901 RepID=UPI0020A37CB5